GRENSPKGFVPTGPAVREHRFSVHVEVVKIEIRPVDPICDKPAVFGRNMAGRSSCPQIRIATGKHDLIHAVVVYRDIPVRLDYSDRSRSAGSFAIEVRRLRHPSSEQTFVEMT